MGWRYRYFSLAPLFFPIAAPQAHATDAVVTGLFPGKAVVIVNGGRPQVLSVGQKTPEGVRLISADSRSAVLEIDGKARTLGMGEAISVASASPSGKQKVVLTADSQGHFVTLGSINGAPTRFLVDTGASFVSLGSAEAKRLGISYLRGERGMMQTANGAVPAYRVILDTVRVGDIALNRVEGVVNESDMPVVLLGMSFLSRVEMKREGTSLTLTRQY
jgi:aspartyl protease family protein